MLVHTYSCTYIHMHTHADRCTHIYIHVCTYMLRHTHVHIYTGIHNIHSAPMRSIYMHTHTCSY